MPSPTGPFGWSNRYTEPYLSVECKALMPSFQVKWVMNEQGCFQGKAIIFLMIWPQIAPHGKLYFSRLCMAP